MSLYKQYFTIIGLLALTVVVSILLLPQNMILTQTVTFIGTNSRWASADQTLVRTKMDLGNVEHVRKFPIAIGEWRGIDYETSPIEEQLNAEVILLRAYQSPGFYQSIFLLIMQSSDPGSFHPPPLCYPALGYQIEEEREEEIPISNIEWVSSWRSETEQNMAASINVNKLVVFQESNGEVTERRVVFYFYVKERPASKDKLTMVRVSALAPVDMSYDGVLSLTRDFMGEVVPYLFEFYEEEPDEMLAARLAKSGAGRLLMAVSVIVPLALIVYPRRLPKKPFDRKRETTAVAEERLTFTAPELLAEVENNRRIATEPWTGKLLTFHTSMWNTSVDAVYTLPANLREDITEAYVDIGLANSIVRLSTELGRRSRNLDESYIKLCTYIAARLDRIMPWLKRSGS